MMREVSGSRLGMMQRRGRRARPAKTSTDAREGKGREERGGKGNEAKCEEGRVGEGREEDGGGRGEEGRGGAFVALEARERRDTVCPLLGKSATGRRGTTEVA